MCHARSASSRGSSTLIRSSWTSPPSVVPKPLKQRAQRGSLETLRLEKPGHELRVAQRKTWKRMLLAGKSLRVFERTLENEPRHRIDIDRRHLTAQPHRFQRYRTPSRERIQHPWGPSPVSPANLLPEPLQILVVLPPPMKNTARRLLLHILHQAAVHPSAIQLIDQPPGHPLQNRLPLFHISGIAKQRRNQRRSARRQRPPRWPDMQRRNMPMPHVLLVHRVDGNLFHRKPHLYQAPLATPHGHQEITRLELRSTDPNVETIRLLTPRLYRRFAPCLLDLRLATLSSSSRPIGSATLLMAPRASSTITELAPISIDPSSIA